MLGDQSSVVDVAANNIQVAASASSRVRGGKQSHPIVQVQVRDVTAPPTLSPQQIQGIVDSAKAGDVFKYFVHGDPITIAKPIPLGAVGSGVVIAMGVYALIDGVIYWHSIDTRGYNNAVSVGPFTAIGTADVKAWESMNPDQGLETHLTPQEAQTFIHHQPLSPDQALQMAQDRARKKGTTVCLELAAMAGSYPVTRGAAFMNTISAINSALSMAGCDGGIPAGGTYTNKELVIRDFVTKAPHIEPITDFDSVYYVKGVIWLIEMKTATGRYPNDDTVVSRRGQLWDAQFTKNWVYNQIEYKLDKYLLALASGSPDLLSSTLKIGTNDWHTIRLMLYQGKIRIGVRFTKPMEANLRSQVETTINGWETRHWNILGGHHVGRDLPAK